MLEYVFSEMKELAVERDAAVYTAAISAMEKEGKWQQALDLFEGVYIDISNCE